MIVRSVLLLGLLFIVGVFGGRARHSLEDAVVWPCLRNDRNRMEFFVIFPRQKGGDFWLLNSTGGGVHATTEAGNKRQSSAKRGGGLVGKLQV